MPAKKYSDYQMIDYESYGETWKLWFKQTESGYNIMNIGFHGKFEKFARLTSKTIKNVKNGFAFLNIDDIDEDIQKWLVDSGVGSFTGKYVKDGFENIPEFKFGKKFYECLEID